MAEQLTGASLVARLEALQRLWNKKAAWNKSVAEYEIYRECADALDPILALARQLEEKKDDQSRVDGERLPEGQDLPRPPTGVITTMAETDIYRSFDARVWAKAFCDIFENIHHFRPDEGWMLSWFASALMRGYDENRWQNERYERSAEERNQAATARILDLVAALAACEAREQSRVVPNGGAYVGTIDNASARHKDFEERLKHEADAVIALVHQQQIMAKQIEELQRLAREATNGWACFAKRKSEQDEIARLHQRIDGVHGVVNR